MNLQQAQVNINLLKPHLESAKTPQQKAIILSQIKRYEQLLGKAKKDQAEQFWKDLEANYASAEATSQFESTVVTTDPEQTVEATK